MEKIVITGIAGFIGHNIALHLNRKYEVVGVDSFERASGKALEKLRRENITIIKSNIILNRNSLEKILKNTYAVVHAAAYVSVDESINHPLKYTHNNVCGTVSMLKSSVENNVERFIYLSSAAVYGNPEKLPIRENHPTNPISPYGATKLSSEIFVKTFQQTYGLNYIILRLFNVYGPGQENTPYSGVITKFISRLNNEKPPIIFGDGRQTRDFIHVEDVVNAVELALKTKHVNETYNIASGKPIRIIDLAKTLIKIYGLNLKPIHYPPRPGDIRHSYADISKAKTMLNFKPGTSLREGLLKLIREQ